MRIIKKILITVFAVTAFTLSSLAFGCSCGENPVSFSLDNAELEVRLGLTEKLNVVSDGEVEAVFTSANTSIATVDEKGVVSGESVGETEITATVGKISETCKVKVVDMGGIPTISYKSVNPVDGTVSMLINNKFEIDAVVELYGEKVNGTISFTSEKPDTVSVEGNVLTAKALGETTVNGVAVYKQWTCEKSFKVKVVEDVNVKLVKNNEIVNEITVCSSGIVNQETTANVGVAEVYKNGVKDYGATVEWISEDDSIAEVNQSGKVTAKNVGETFVKAKSVINGIDYYGFVKVNVVKPYLSAPETFEINENDKTLVWNSVPYANKYLLKIDVEEIELGNSVLSYDVSEFLGSKNFSITAQYSNPDLVDDSKVKSFNYTFNTRDYEDYLVQNYNGIEAKISAIDYNDEVLKGEKIYYADCSDLSYALGQFKTGGAFKMIYITTQTQQWGDRYGVPFKQVKSLINSTETTGAYYGALISFWAYSYNRELKLSVARTTGSSGFTSANGTTVLGEAKVPENSWTKVSISITSDYFSNTMFDMLSADGSFYFADFRISYLDYTGEDYADCGFYMGYDATTLIDELPVSTAITKTNFTQYTEQISKARQSYDYLVGKHGVLESELSAVYGHHQKLTDCEVEYIKSAVLSLPELSAYSESRENDIREYRDFYNNLDDMAKEKAEARESGDKIYDTLSSKESALFGLTVVKFLKGTNEVTNEALSNFSKVAGNVQKVRDSYNSLTAMAKEKVVDLDLSCLTDAENLMANRVISLISALNNENVTVDKFESSRDTVADELNAILTVRNYYGLLTENAKQTVNNLSRLESAESNYETVSKNVVKSLVDNLESPSKMKYSQNTLNGMYEEYQTYKSAIEKARTEYNALLADAKKAVGSEFAKNGTTSVETVEAKLSNVESKLALMLIAYNASQKIADIVVPEDVSSYDAEQKQAFFASRINDLIDARNTYTALGDSIKALVPSWVVAEKENKSEVIFSCGRDYLINMINGLPEEGNVQITDYNAIYVSYTIFGSMSEEMRNSLSDVYGKLVRAKNEFDGKWNVAFDYTVSLSVSPINYPWANYSDSYRAIGEVSYATDDDFGGVAKVNLRFNKEQNTSSNVGANGQFKLDLSGINKAVNNTPNATKVIFYMKRSSGTTLYITGTDPETGVERSNIKTVNLTAGEWTRVELTLNELKTLDGAVRGSSLVGETTPTDIYVSNFFVEIG